MGMFELIKVVERLSVLLSRPDEVFSSCIPYVEVLGCLSAF
jgi:hypothetical protein